MTEKLYSRDFPRDALSRALSILLLSVIVYGTTVEAAHRHGNVAAPVAGNNSPAFSNSSTGNTLGGDLLGCNDCLICQLHQSFSSSLLSVPLDLALETVTARYSKSTSLVLHSQARATQSGRGPPLLSV